MVSVDCEDGSAANGARSLFPGVFEWLCLVAAGERHAGKRGTSELTGEGPVVWKTQLGLTPDAGLVHCTALFLYKNTLGEVSRDFCPTEIGRAHV